MVRRARGRLGVVAAVVALAGCGGGSSTGGGNGPTATSGPAPPPAGSRGATLPPGYHLAADLPTVVSHRLGRIGYRCDGSRRQLAVTSSGATEFIRFLDDTGRVRRAGDLDRGFARGPLLESLRQSVQIVLAVEPGTAVVDLDVAFPRAPCEVQQMRVRIESNQNTPPRSPRERRVNRLGRRALEPHRNIGSKPAR